jgi:hypothetical protein
MQDRRFSEQTRERSMRVAADIGDRPLDGLLAPLADLSERLHLRLAPPGEAPRLAAWQAARRLAAMRTAADRGRSGLALEAWDAARRDILALSQGPDAARYRPALREALHASMAFFIDLLPEVPAYPLKLKVEELSADLARPDGPALLHARLLGIEARLDEAERLIGSSSLDAAEGGLAVAEQGLANVIREMEQSPGASADEMRLLRSKVAAARTRLAATRIRLATALVPPTGRLGQPTTTAAGDE